VTRLDRLARSTAELLRIAQIVDNVFNRYQPERGLGGRFALALPDASSCIVGRDAIGMFIVTEADAAAIRAVVVQEGGLSAAIELRRRFPGITDNANARAHARSIAGWTPLPVQPHPVTRLRPRKDS
jgi:hypothetical protein